MLISLFSILYELNPRRKIDFKYSSGFSFFNQSFCCFVIFLFRCLSVLSLWLRRVRNLADLFCVMALDIILDRANRTGRIKV